MALLIMVVNNNRTVEILTDRHRGLGLVVADPWI